MAGLIADLHQRGWTVLSAAAETSAFAPGVIVAVCK